MILLSSVVDLERSEYKPLVSTEFQKMWTEGLREANDDSW